MLNDIPKFFDTLRSTAIVPNVKARITITGLAGCSLNSVVSRIRFLRHDSKHELTLVIEGRRQDNNQVVWTHDPVVLTKKPVKVSVVGTNGEVPIEADPPKNLNDMVNFHTVHSGPVELAHVEKTTTLDLVACSFYSHDTYAQGVFDLVEKDNPANRRATKVGFVLGGYINGSPNSTTTVEYEGFANGKLELQGTIDGAPVVYDIHFNNHCKGDKISGCKSDVSGMHKTDFGIYYQVYTEVLDPTRIFHLEKNIHAPKGIVTAEIAACNPTIVDPPPAR
jgi:hypothetical protein